MHISTMYEGFSFGTMVFMLTIIHYTSFECMLNNFFRKKFKI